VLIAALVIVGWISVYLLLRRMLQRSIEQLDSDLRDQLQALRNPVQQSSLAVRNEPPFEAGSRGDRESQTDDIETIGIGDGKFTGMGPEEISALRTTLNAFVGREVRIRSVKKIPASNAMSNAWAREGCVLVQNSHDFEVSKIRARPAAKHVAGPSSDEAKRRAA
jgi:hypothetical protein